jgi:hypothetical protein
MGRFTVAFLPDTFNLGYGFIDSLLLFGAHGKIKTTVFLISFTVFDRPYR